LCQKLNFAFQYVDSTDLFKSDHLRNFVISGGVAANSFIRRAAEKIATYHGFKTRLPPKQLVTDNAVVSLVILFIIK
jgi:tRNA A37 threonylcarbamoyltransferase TsaD